MSQSNFQVGVLYYFCVGFLLLWDRGNKRSGWKCRMCVRHSC